jgi:hypothetical protein
MTTKRPQKLIEDMLEKKRVLKGVDPQGVFPCLPPNPPAGAAAISEAERRIGEPLDAKYKQFVEHAAGWPCVVNEVDLFGPAELGTSALFLDGVQRLTWMAEEGVLQELGLTPEELLPIAAARHGIDVYAIARRSSPLAGTIIWFQGYEVERYADFFAYFQAIIGYHDATIASQRAESGRS